MKFVLLFVTLLLSTFSLAHEDHLLGEGFFHNLYHWVFFLLSAVVIYKSIKWLRMKNLEKKLLIEKD